MDPVYISRKFFLSNSFKVFHLRFIIVGRRNQINRRRRLEQERRQRQEERRRRQQQQQQQQQQQKQQQQQQEQRHEIRVIVPLAVGSCSFTVTSAR